MYKNLSTARVHITAHQNEVIEMSLTHGFDGMDLDMNEFLLKVNEFGREHARRLIDSAKINIATFNLPLAWQEWEEGDTAYRKGLEELPQIAELAGELGCHRVLTEVPPASDERPYHENFEFCRKRVIEIAEVLRPHGVQLGLSFTSLPALRQGRAFQFIHTFEGLLQLVKMSDAENVGLVVDLFDMHVSGAGLEEIQALAAEQIVAVHLSDVSPEANLEEAETSMRLMPGAGGVIDNVAVLRILNEKAYLGPVSIRVGRGNVPGRNRDAKVKSVAECLDRLWKEAGLVKVDELAATATE